jgi:hypothetical protein
MATRTCARWHLPRERYIWNAILRMERTHKVALNLEPCNQNTESKRTYPPSNLDISLGLNKFVPSALNSESTVHLLTGVVWKMSWNLVSGKSGLPSSDWCWWGQYNVYVESARRGLRTYYLHHDLPNRLDFQEVSY